MFVAMRHHNLATKYGSPPLWYKSKIGGGAKLMGMVYIACLYRICNGINRGSTKKIHSKQQMPIAQYVEDLMTDNLNLHYIKCP